jgi:hypothetical protein
VFRWGCGSSTGYRRVVVGLVVGFLEWVLVEWTVEAEARKVERAVQMLSRDVVGLFWLGRNAFCGIQM